MWSTVTLFSYDFYYSIPEIILLTGIFVVFVYGVFRKNITEWFSLVIGTVLCTLIVCWYNLPGIDEVFYLYNYVFVKDYFSEYGKIVLLIVFLVFLFSFFGWCKNVKLKNFEVILLALLSLFGSILMLSSNDLFFLYLAIELQSLCFYILAAIRIKSVFSVEAGLKYFILGSFASGLLLFGISFVYGFSGMTNFSDLSIFLVPYSLDNFVFGGLLLGFIFITIALLFKLGSVPFHMWLPDVYEGAPTIITFLFITMPKISLIFVFIKIYYFLLSNLVEYWSLVFLICGLLSLVVGSFAALYQTKIKRLIAYSTITHIGFLLLGFSVNSFDGYFAVLYYVLVYVCIVMGLLMPLVLIRYFSNFNLISKIKEFGYFSSYSPVLKFLLILVIFSNAGIPPLSGFFSKFYVLLALLNANMYLVVFLIIVISVVSAVYYIRLVHMLFFSDISKKNSFLTKLDGFSSFVLVNVQFTNLMFVLVPNFLFLFVMNLVFYFF